MAEKGELLARLTGQLYEGVLTEDGWGEALQTISTVTDSPQASVVVFDKQSQALAVNETHGISDEAVTAFNAYYHQLDEGRAVALSIPFGTWYYDRRDIGEHTMRRSEYYQDFLLRHDIATTLCNRLLGQEQTDAFLSLSRCPSQPHYTDADMTAFGQFIPHVQRAVHLRMHMQRLTERAGLASVVLDGLRVPLLVLDESGRVLLANAEAEALMQRQPLLAVRLGCLYPQGLRVGQFMQLLQSACGRHGPPVAGGVTLPNAQGHPALQLLVLPLPARMQSLNRWARPLALVMPHEPSRAHGLPPHLLQQLYGLTPAEARLALALCQGDAPAQAAQRLGVSVGTARIQLKAIFAKMRVNRQVDLIRMLVALRAVG